MYINEEIAHRVAYDATKPLHEHVKKLKKLFEVAASMAYQSSLPDALQAALKDRKSSRYIRKCHSIFVVVGQMPDDAHEIMGEEDHFPTPDRFHGQPKFTLTDAHNDIKAMYYEWQAAHNEAYELHQTLKQTLEQMYHYDTIREQLPEVAHLLPNQPDVDAVDIDILDLRAKLTHLTTDK